MLRGMRMGRLDPLAANGFTELAERTAVPGYSGEPLTPFARSRMYPVEVPSELEIARFARPELPPLEEADPRQPYQIPAPQSVRDELKYARFQAIPFSIGTASQKVLLAPPPDTRRVYLLIVNTSALNLLYVSFGQDATTVVGVPVMLNFGFWEFEMTVPQDDIYIVGAGAATTGVVVYSNKAVRS